MSGCPDYDARIWPAEIGLTPVVSGSRRSGKSTFLKQMNLRWSGSLCDVEEREGMSQVIFGNMIKDFHGVVRYMRQKGIQYQHEKSLVRHNFLYPNLSNDTERSIATR